MPTTIIQNKICLHYLKLFRYRTNLQSILFDILSPYQLIKPIGLSLRNHTIPEFYWTLFVPNSYGVQPRY